MFETISQSNLANDARTAAYNGGSLRCLSGAKAADVSTEPVGTLLATLTFSATAFGASVNRVATANAIAPDSSADASGTIGHVVCFTSGGTAISSHTASLSGGGGEAIFDSLSTVAGLPVACSGMTITQPNGA